MKKLNKYLLLISIILITNLSANQIDVAEIVTSFDERPGNVAISKEGKVYLSIHPFLNPDTKVVELTLNGKITAYPNSEYSKGKGSINKSILGIKVDTSGNLWMLDLHKNQFVVWNTKEDRLKKIIKIPNDVLKPASFLQDFVIDEKRNRAIIADMTQRDLKSAPEPAFVVVDTISGKSKRIAQNHPSMMPDFKGGFGLDPISIDPEFNWIYFGAVHGKKVYRVPAESFSSEQSVVENIKEYGPKSYSDGIIADAQGNVYITDIEKNAIGLTTTAKYKIIASLPKGQSWPDGFAIGNDGYVYVTVNQLDKVAAFNNGKEQGKSPYLLVRIKAISNIK